MAKEDTMIKKGMHKLTLDQPASYQIKIQGKLGENWSDWASGIKVAVESDDSAPPITTLTGLFDQAALLGLLRRLYSLGIPLISVICLEFSDT